MKKSAMHPDINVVAHTDYDGNSFPETQVLPIGETGTSVPGEAYHPYGFIGRCNDADVDPKTGDVTNGARVLFFYEGSTLHTVMLDDPRVTPTLPQVPKGGSQQYDAGGAYALMDGQGNYLLKVPSGTTVTVQVGSGAEIVVSDSTVKIGDDLAAALAHSLETGNSFSALSTALTALSAYAAAIAGIADPSNVATPVLTAAIVAAKAILSSAAATLPTTKALGT